MSNEQDAQFFDVHKHKNGQVSFQTRDEHVLAVDADGSLISLSIYDEEEDTLFDVTLLDVLPENQVLLTFVDEASQRDEPRESVPEQTEFNSDSTLSSMFDDPDNKPIKRVRRSSVFDEPVGQPVDKPINKPVDKPDADPDDKLIDKPDADPDDQSDDKPINKPVDKPDADPVDKPVDKPVDIPDRDSRDEVLETAPFTFDGRTVSRVLQQHNGPCALVSLANVLLIRGTLEVAARSSITLDSLIQKLNAHLRTSADREMFSRHASTMREGMCVNIKFKDTDSFAVDDTAADIYRLFDIPLYHCFVDEELKFLTYDQVRDTACLHKILTDESGSRKWYTQLGLQRLRNKMRDDTTAVLFIEGHFFAIYKRSKDKTVYCLQNSQPVYHADPRLTWHNVNPSNRIMVDSDFTAVSLKENTELITQRIIDETEETLAFCED